MHSESNRNLCQINKNGVLYELHSDIKTFSDAIQASSDRLKIPPVFIEKDYWITLVLRRLSENDYMESAVFKGGTSLLKGYKLIERFFRRP